MTRMSSASLSCNAMVSRYCVFWIRNTISAVTIVVVVLMPSCQVLLNSKNGPLERFPGGLSRFPPIGDFQTAANQIRSSLPATARAIMAKVYSTDLRVRVVALVEAGDSRREVGRLLDLPASTTIRWMDRWQTTGSVAAKPGT